MAADLGRDVDPKQRRPKADSNADGHRSDQERTGEGTAHSVDASGQRGSATHARWRSGEGGSGPEEDRFAQASVLSPGGLFTALMSVPADLGADPTESQRGCLCVPDGALDPTILNTRCPHVPAPAPRSRDLEMRYTASSGIEGSNPSRSGFRAGSVRSTLKRHSGCPANRFGAPEPWSTLHVRGPIALIVS
jgi:hypothetical protein